MRLPLKRISYMFYCGLKHIKYKEDVLHKPALVLSQLYSTISLAPSQWLGIKLLSFQRAQLCLPLHDWVTLQKAFGVMQVSAACMYCTCKILIRFCELLQNRLASSPYFKTIFLGSLGSNNWNGKLQIYTHYSRNK